MSPRIRWHRQKGKSDCCQQHLRLNGSSLSQSDQYRDVKTVKNPGACPLRKTALRTCPGNVTKRSTLGPLQVAAPSILFGSQLVANLGADTRRENHVSPLGDVQCASGKVFDLATVRLRFD